MDVDARTRETAATLLGVAYKRTHTEASDSTSNRHGSEPSGIGSTANGTRPTATPDGISDVPSSSATLSSHQPHHQPDPYIATTTAPLTTPPPSFPNGTAATQLFHHKHLPPAHHAHVIPPASAPSAAGGSIAAPALTTPDHNSSTLLSMSSIGFGIDSSQASSWGDATEAAVKSLQDAMERSTLRLPMGSNAQSTATSLQIQVQLGVPAKQLGSPEPMLVDITRVTNILPRGIPVLPIRVSVGGLHLPGSPPVCTAVACITLQTEAAAVAVSAVTEPPQLPTPANTPTAMSSQHVAQHTNGTPASWARLETNCRPEPLHAPPTSVPSPAVPHVSVPPIQAANRDPLQKTTPLSGPGTGSAVAGVVTSTALVHGGTPSDAGHHHPNVAAAAMAAASKPKTHQSSTSIEMLAIISEEMRLAGDVRSSSAAPLHATSVGNHFPPIAARKQYQEAMSAPLMGPATNALQQPTKLEYHTPFDAASGAYAVGQTERPGSPLSAEEAMLRNAGAYNYQKLPPGVTTKNNRRLFVKHKYHDYSGEVPLPEEQDLIVAGGGTTSAARTPNAAFPLKLHETLSQIEKHGHGDIIGWMPHGRSFRIHMQKEFAEIILPRYFVMTKKSSFLRQLNLYGFNRFSAGPDQGSYYHEKFLRGLKFLCRRMTRQKVNGNRIRSAGNPDDEPVLSRYPVCPPPTVKTLATGNAMAASSANGLTVAPPVQPTKSPPNTVGNSVQDGGKPISKGEGQEIATLESAEEEYSKEGKEDRAYDGQGSAAAPSSNRSSATHKTQPRQSGDVHVTFPLKLQRMLDKLEAEGQTDAVSWLSHGRAFIIRNSDAFVDKLLSVHFNRTKFSSFQRQLQLYCFQRIATGRDKGAYYHTHFQRGKPHLCVRMVRSKVNGTGPRKPGNPTTEPNLYSLQPLPAISFGAKIEVPSGSIGDDDDSDGES